MTLARILALAIGGCAATAAQPTTATVRLQVVNFFGKPLSYRVAAFVDSKTGAKSEVLFNGLVGTRVAYGSYRYRLIRADIQEKGEFGAVDGELSVYRPEVCKTLVTTGLVVIIEGHEAAVDFAGPPSNYSREGRVTHFPDATRPTWIRIQALFGGQVVEAAVGSDGKFKIYDPLDGEYLLVVFANDRVASVETRIFDKRFSTDPILITSAVTGHQQ